MIRRVRIIIPRVVIKVRERAKARIRTRYLISITIFLILDINPITIWLLTKRSIRNGRRRIRRSDSILTNLLSKTSRRIRRVPR